MIYLNDKPLTPSETAAYLEKHEWMYGYFLPPAADGQTRALVLREDHEKSMQRLAHERGADVHSVTVKCIHPHSVAAEVDIEKTPAIYIDAESFYRLSQLYLRLNYHGHADLPFDMFVPEATALPKGDLVIMLDKNARRDEQQPYLGISVADFYPLINQPGETGGVAETSFTNIGLLSDEQIAKYMDVDPKIYSPTLLRLPAPPPQCWTNHRVGSL